MPYIDKDVSIEVSVLDVIEKIQKNTPSLRKKIVSMTIEFNGDDTITLDGESDVVAIILSAIEDSYHFSVLRKPT